MGAGGDGIDRKGSDLFLCHRYFSVNMLGNKSRGSKKGNEGCSNTAIRTQIE